ncbi:hypothetical protein MF545_00385 [Stenotrophomonas maltophilia]|nr:hypothetical protein [Stenotrophomonas maltophilia]
MDAIEKRARDLLAAQFNPEGREQFERGQAVVVTTAGALNAIIAALTPPDGPDPALLISMAMCLDHGFGLNTFEQQQCALRSMRKLWDEVMGRGYYSEEGRHRYEPMLAARPEVS